MIFSISGAILVDQKKVTLIVVVGAWEKQYSRQHQELIRILELQSGKVIESLCSWANLY